MSGRSKPTASERESLRTARQREKVAKTEARRRLSELKADFENKLASHFHFDQSRAFEEIERQSLMFQIRILGLGLDSIEAQELLDEMPTAEQLMPPLNLKDAITALAQVPEALPFGRYGALPFDDDDTGDAP